MYKFITFGVSQALGAWGWGGLASELVPSPWRPQVYMTLTCTGGGGGGDVNGMS